MTTEERVSRLEQSLTTLNRVTAEQMQYNQDVAHNMTILLGVVGSQGQDIKAALARLDSIESRLDGVDHRLDSIESRLDGVVGHLNNIESRMDMQFAGVQSRLDDIVALLGGGQP